MTNTTNTDRYDDIIALSHPTSAKHPRMSAINRAAQFAPFAALTGYDAVIEETGRYTQERRELDESEIRLLDEKIHLLLEQQEDPPAATITYFKPDELKAGGAYIDITGVIHHIDRMARELVFADKRRIPVDEIIAVDSELFRRHE